MSMKAIWGSVALSLAICGATDLHARELKPSEKRIVIAAVTQNFKDPESARFKWLPISKFAAEGQSYCGLVNGKNSYGAYAGYEAFIVFVNSKGSALVSATVLAVGSPSEDTIGEAVTEQCQKEGMDLSLAK
jgi:hypothetical protein